ncbi:unnamed protein product [Lepeophtheirus salmonis]|uniref:(salmon louse) hypothetical protein n=1 Tax=Lepeophtheirus salmonis TaxID=72036 RepID=A0A7R8H9T2_LEPSM|nr:unnamed protein product [Lepeophtheirus salmonis]CAF2954738.1 unnamed protein product [Lepeophtheirus salmonis]
MRKFELIPSSFICFFVLFLLLESSTSSSGLDKRATLLRRDILGNWYTLMRNNIIEENNENEKDMVNEDEEPYEVVSNGRMIGQRSNQERRDEGEEEIVEGNMFQKKQDSISSSFRIPNKVSYNLTLILFTFHNMP